MASSMTNLDPVFTSLISNLMLLERQPLTRLTQQRDDLAVKRAVYIDLKSRMDALKTSVSSLKSDEAFYNFAPGRKVAFTNVETGFTVASAAVSTSAVPGEYNITNISLAKEHRVRSDQQLSSTQELGLSGSIVMGGQALRSVAAETSNATISTFESTQPNIGQQELGSGSYFVETKLSSGVQQFRVVDSNGTAVSIQATGGTSYTASWQTLPAAGTFDTGRGLKFNVSSDFVEMTKGNGAASINYTAQGATLSIESTDTLEGIASKINNASYAANQGVRASIVDKQLILTAQQSGTAYSVVASGDVLQSLGVLTDLGGFKNQMQAGLNATFNVNGLPVVRSSNTGLSDVVSGVTLNLASDAQGRSATMMISGDTSPQKNTITDFLTKFNALTSYIGQKIAITKNADGSYARGALSSDQAISSFRYDMFRMVGGSINNNGYFRNLNDLGITISDSMNAMISDTSKLEKALISNPNDVKRLLDGLMTNLQSKLNNYVGTKSYVDQAIRSADDQTKSMNDMINSMNTRLDMRQQNLINQFTDAQSQIQSMQYERQTLSSLYGSINTYS
jgi:flagellar capping protein FliD